MARLTAEESEAISRRIAREERRAQGLPEKIEDPTFYARLARTIAGERAGQIGAGESATREGVAADSAGVALRSRPSKDVA